MIHTILWHFLSWYIGFQIRVARLPSCQFNCSFDSSKSFFLRCSSLPFVCTAIKCFQLPLFISDAWPLYWCSHNVSPLKCNKATTTQECGPMCVGCDMLLSLYPAVSILTLMLLSTSSIMQASLGIAYRFLLNVLVFYKLLLFYMALTSFILFRFSICAHVIRAGLRHRPYQRSPIGHHLLGGALVVKTIIKKIILVE